MLEQAQTSELTAGQQVRYVVHLSAFDGPLDLLLHLIEKRQMEITAISLVEVTDQYLDYLQSWEAESLPLANMAAFVSIAARLLYIKSQSLLPHTGKEQEDAEMESAADMADELQRHLVEYKLTKQIAQVLRQREEQGLQTYGRSGLLAGIEAQLAWTPPVLAGLEVQTLARAFQRLLELQDRDIENGNELMPAARIRVSERIAEVRSQLEAHPSILLSDVLLHERSRLIIIVTFIAVLELWKWERINVRQDELMGPIILEHGERWAEAWQEMVDD
ncbi:MAG: segregation/condensation protein A [Ktedonobacteraceae bacterium]